MSDFTQLVDLASERVGGRVIAANDDFFAPKENLIKTSKPVFIEDQYTDRGKWMDGWESRRRRTEGHDWCIVQLGASGILRGVIVDTSYFRGNYPESCSIEACTLNAAAEVDRLLSSETQWTEVLKLSSLKGDSQNAFNIEDPHRYTHLRLHIYPDGGVARLRVFGKVVPDWRKILSEHECADLGAVEHGGQIIDCSDKFFSEPQNLLMPGKSAHMGDGWETRRRRGPGHDWAIIRLGIGGSIKEIEVDTSHFKGNFPESCSLESCNAETAGDESLSNAAWKEFLPRTPLEADKVRTFSVEKSGPVTHVRFNMFPDGGVARLRIRGTPTPEGRKAAGLRWLNALPDQDARQALLDCCGTETWSKQMLRRRPFSSFEHLLREANTACDHLSEHDWLEAFRHHPKIGEQKAAGDKRAQQWSEQEQSVVADASPETLSALKKGNEVYYSRFGYIFIVCATGKSPEEMLDLLQQRLKNDPQMELHQAANEQRKITKLRLEKMLSL